jgi:hypothetical protein
MDEWQSNVISFPAAQRMQVASFIEPNCLVLSVPKWKFETTFVS